MGETKKLTIEEIVSLFGLLEEYGIDEVYIDALKEMLYMGRRDQETFKQIKASVDYNCKTLAVILTSVSVRTMIAKANVEMLSLLERCSTAGWESDEDRELRQANATLHLAQSIIKAN